MEPEGTDEQTDEDVSGMASIRVPRQAFEEARQRKEESGQTWAEFITDTSRGTPSSEEIAEKVACKLEELGR